MRRRLDLASALVHRPEVLFLDEPTTGLDPVSRKAIWEEVRKLNDEGTTVFLTTQYLEEADQLADRVGIISGGLLVAEGTPGALKAEVGSPHLELCLVEQEGKEARAEEVLARFGKPLPARDGTLMVELKRGVAEVGPIVVALNQVGLNVESLDLVQPSLDDVFVQKTGHHLEGAEDFEGRSAGEEPAVLE
jgi:ABC-2 type transport system ATP-binding protein